MFGPRQVGEVIVGSALATQKTADEFIASANDKEVAVVGALGGEANANDPFIVLQKTDGDASVGLNYVFSDRVDPKTIEKLNGRAFKPEVMGVVEVTGFDDPEAIKPMRTYEVCIRSYGDISPLNYDDIFGYYSTGEVLGKDTKDTVLNGLAKSLQENLRYRGNTEYVVTVDTDKLVITEKSQPVVLGKKDGRKLEFVVTAKVFNNVSNGYNGDLGYLTAEKTVKGDVGQGVGKRVANYEWFCHGYKYDPSRDFAYPLNFEQPQYSKINGEYDTIQIVYYSARTETSVERQYKVLSIFIEKGKAKALYDEIAALAVNAKKYSDLA